MFIVSSFTLNYNSEKEITHIISAEKVNCPLCDGNLTYRNSKPRGRIDIAGIKSFFLLRRFTCSQCQRLHTEIPDFLQPFKHYDSHAIQSVLDNTEDAAICAADDSTMRRWRKTFREAAPDIGQRLNSLYAQTSDELVPISAGVRILAQIRAEQRHWLVFVMALLINQGHVLCTRFAFCPFPYSGKVSAKDKIMVRGDSKSDKTFENSS